MTIAEHQFNGLLNADDTPEKVAPNEYVALNNMRIGVSRDGKYNLLQLIEGTQAIETNALPSTGVNKCRGVHLNPFTNEVIFFVWNSLGDHGIYLLATDNTVTKIAEDDDFETGLGFTEYYWIHNIDTVGDLLYWTIPGRNPCRVNYRRLIDAEFTLPMAEPIYTTIRKPPAYPVTASKKEASALTPAITLLTNQIADKAFKFTYQYIYKDNENSTLCPHSRALAYNVAGAVEDIVEIKIPFAEKIAEDVAQVRLIVINLPDNTYFEIKVWDTTNDATAIADHNAETTQLTYYYAADKLREGIDKVQAVKPFDNVPREAGAQEIAKDRLFFGDVLMGYNTPNQTSLAISITNANVGNDFDDILNRSTSISWDETTFDPGPLPLPTIITADVDFTMASGDTEFEYDGTNTTGAKITVNIQGSITKTNATAFNFSLNVMGNFQTFDFVAGIFSSELFNITHEFSANIDLNDVVSFNIINPSGIGTLQLDASVSVIIGRRQASLAGDANSLKGNAGYGAGIVFYDRYLRQTGVRPTTQRVQTAARTAYGNSGIDPQLIEWTLDNTDRLLEIPENAWYYQIVKTQVPGSFIQSHTSQLKYVTRKPEEGDDFTTISGDAWVSTAYAIAIRLKELYNSGYGYTFNEGDIVYCWLKTGPPDYFESEVIGQVGEYILCQPKDVGAFSGTRFAIFEIRTPGQQTDFYYETAAMYPVNNPGTTARAYAVTGGILPGDTYLLTQSFDSASLTYEAMSPSVKNWKRWITNAGRVQVENNIGEVRKTTGITFSNVYLFGSRNNGLSSFEVLNQEQLPLSLSRVRKLILTNKPQEEGTVLMAMGEAGRDTVSIYIGEAEINDVNGQVFLAKSDRVIGQVNALRGNYGTNHPESIGAEAGLLIWLDVAKGTVVQYASNGLQPVGRNKADGFWRKWCSRYIATGSTEPIPGCIDVVTEQYLVKTPAISNEPCKTGDFYNEGERIITYQIGESKWSNACDIPTEAMIVRDNTLISWYKGKPLTHSSTNYCWIYDRNVTPSITIAVNAGNPNATKIFNWIELICQAKPVKVVMEITDPDKQHTELYAANFETIEGKQYADIMCDMWTPGMAAGTAIFNGREMRGRVMLLTMYWVGGEGQRVDLASAFIGLQESIGHTV